MFKKVGEGSSSAAAAVPSYFNECTAVDLTPIAEVNDLHRCKDGFGLSAREVFMDAATRYNANFEEVWFHPFLRLRIHPKDVQAIRSKFENSTMLGLPSNIQATLRNMQSNADTLLEAGRALASADELAALETLDQCLRTAPDTGEAYQVRAKIYQSMGNHAQAACDLVMGSVLANGAGMSQDMDWMDLSPRSSRPRNTGACVRVSIFGSVACTRAGFSLAFAFASTVAAVAPSCFAKLTATLGAHAGHRRRSLRREHQHRSGVLCLLRFASRCGEEQH